MSFYQQEASERNNAAPLSVKTILARGKFTDADQKLIDDGTAEIRMILGLIQKLQPGRNGQPCKLHEDSDAALEQLSLNPSSEAAEAAHDAIVRERDAQVSFERIDAALHVALNRNIEAFRPIAERLIDQVRADVVSEGSKLQKQLEAGDKIFGESLEIQDFKNRLQRTLDMIDNERHSIAKEGAALHWLGANGFCTNPYHE